MRATRGLGATLGVGVGLEIRTGVRVGVTTPRGTSGALSAFADEVETATRAMEREPHIALFIA
ncbi:hypothetical protein [Nonomuraea sp. B19D2]|uniref:hypothetical protein n=1 Tax=Nonomuraea sp. B19D2 TaxID=3159561 RepID=UPI0032DB5657